MTTPVSHHQARSVWVVVLFLAILAAALGLRLYQLDAEGYWIDEFFSMEVSSGRGFADQTLPRAVVLDPPLPQLSSLSGAPRWTKIWTSMDQDSHPPLYFLLLRLWRTLFGSGEWACRFLSVLISMAAIVVLFGIAMTLYGSTVALWASFLVAIAVPQLVYAQEARNNPMLVLTSLLAAAALIWIERTKASPLRLVCLGAALLAMLLTNYYCIGAFLAMAIYVVVSWKGKARKFTVTSFVATAIIYGLAWGPMIIRQLPAIGKWHSTEPATAAHRITAIQRLGVAPLRQFTGVFNDSVVAAAITAAICLVALALLWKKPELRLWWLWIACIFGTLFLHDWRIEEDHLVLPKYALAAGPALFLILCAGARRLPLRSKSWQNAATHGIPALGAALCLYHLPAVYAPYRGDWREPANYLLSRARPGDVVVFTATSLAEWTGGWKYLCVMHELGQRKLNCSAVLLDRPLDQGPTMDRLHHAHSTFVLTDSADVPPEYWLAGCKPIRAENFPITCCVWEVRFPSPATQVSATEPARK